MDKTLLVIDDEELVRGMMDSLMSEAGYRVETASDGVEAIELLQARGVDFFDFILCDMKMPRMDGLEFLERAKSVGCRSTIILMSGYGTVNKAIEAMKLGAYDYIAKPFKTDEVLLTLRKAEERQRLIRENIELKRVIQKEYRYESVVAKSRRMREVLQAIQNVADYRSTVLLAGESGAGKELLAQVLHYNSVRKDGVFLVVHCSGVPEDQLEGELFGVEAEGGAEGQRGKPGAFEQAAGGTLFLDEVGKLPQFLQVRLLRTLQDGVFRRVGGDRDLQVSARLVVATVHDLEKEVEAGRFREDLYYRLNVIPIKVPPLRERRDDIPALLDYFLKKYAGETGKDVRGFSPEAMEALLRYSWRGNVREMENVIERAVVMAEGTTVGLDHLEPWLKEDGRPGAFSIGPEEYSIKKIVARVEEELIRRALRKTKGNRSAASRILEISHRTLLYKLKDYGVDGS